MSAQGDAEQAEYWQRRTIAFLEEADGVYRGSELAEAYEFDAALLPEGWRATASVLAYLGAGDGHSPIGHDLFLYLDQLPKITQREPDGFEFVLGVDHNAVENTLWEGLKDTIGLRGESTPDGVAFDGEGIKTDVLEDYLRAKADIIASIH